MKSIEWKKIIAEFTGTLALVLFGCGVAVFSGGNLIATSLAFGLAIVAAAAIVGSVSGCHVNPAVSLAMAMNGRIKWKQFCQYVAAQIAGAFAGAALLLAFCKLSFENGRYLEGNLGQNGFDANSGIGLNVWGALLAEVLLAFIFVAAVICITAKKEKNNLGKKAGLFIGLVLTLVHLIGIPLTGTSVNPARSLAPAVLVLGEAVEQVWVFIVAPLVGAACAAVFCKYVLGSEKAATLPSE